MARSRKRVKRKSNVNNNQSPQPVSFNRKRNLLKGISDSEQVQCKRRRTCRYNLRESNSVILVSETPCCQTPEQNEKYTRLGLNSALFLKGSQRPKRKQSHISIITISSDDEETSEERTTEWVNSLDLDYLSNVEPECETINPNENLEKNEQTFQPLCSSTPNNPRSAMQNNTEEVISKEFENCASSSTETPVGDPTQKHNISLTPSNEHLKGKSCPVDDQVKPEENFQVVISISNELPDSLSAIRNQLSKCCVDSNVSASYKTNEQIGKANEAETSLPSNAPQNTVSSTGFYFGRPTDKNNITSIPELPFNSNFISPMDLSTDEELMCSLATLDDRQCESNQFDVTDSNLMKNTFGQIETKSNASENLNISETNSQSTSSL